MKTLDRDKALGALLGAAVGDALGTTLEFSPFNGDFSKKLKGPHSEITGGGPFSVSPGQVTDDQQMAVMIANSLTDHGRLECSDIAKRFKEWRKVAFDVGGMTSAAIGLYDRISDPHEASKAAWLQRRPNTAGNGGLMRLAPVAVFFAPFGRSELVTASMQTTALTHYDPVCQLASVAWASIVADLVQGHEPMKELRARAMETLEGAQEELGMITPEHRVPTIAKACQEIIADLMAGRLNRLIANFEHWKKIGYVRVALRLSLRALLTANTFEEGMIDVVNRGGDSDTNGAIVGGMLGAKFGASGIPERWKEAVWSSKPRAPWDSDEYHPRSLIRFFDSLGW